MNIKTNLVRSGALCGLLGSLLYACSSEPPSQEPAPPNPFQGLDVPSLSEAQLETLSGDQAGLRLLMTDAPIDAEHVYVNFCKVEVHAGAEEAAGDAGAEEGDVWRTVDDTCQRYDLLVLRDGVTTELGLQTLPPGSYGQIRLALTEASIVVDGEEHPLTVPSGSQSGLKIIHGFELAAGELTTLVLDFDAEKSIHYAPGAGYIMRPVIKLVAERRERVEDVEPGEPEPADPQPEDNGRPDAGPPNGGDAGQPDAGDPPGQTDPDDLN